MSFLRFILASLLILLCAAMLTKAQEPQLNCDAEIGTLYLQARRYQEQLKAMTAKVAELQKQLAEKSK